MIAASGINRDVWLVYKRLGKYVESTIADAIQFAKSAGVIEGTGQISLSIKTE